MRSEPSRGIASKAVGASEAEFANGVAVFTFTLGCFCLAVGGLGFVLDYQRPHRRPEQEPIVLVERLSVDLTPEPLRPQEPAPRLPDALSPPAVPEPIHVPPIVTPIVVAQPNPDIAFELPVEGPVPVMETSSATQVVPTTNMAALPAKTSPVVQRLTFGQGEGQQPAPSYPPTARNQGQEGTVVVRLTVREDGRVLAAAAAVPSPWPLLDDAALRTIRERWRFQRGARRLYEVAIRFEIIK